MGMLLHRHMVESNPVPEVKKEKPPVENRPAEETKKKPGRKPKPKE